jgi:serine protease Do
VRGGPGEKAGIKRLDVITGVDGAKITNGEDLVGAISSHRAGDTVTVTVFREGKSRDLKAVLGDREKMMKAQAEPEFDDSEGPRNGSPEGKSVSLEQSYGFTVEALTLASRRQFGISGEWKGVVVTSVASRTVAQEKGLRPGFVISAVGTRDIESLQDFYQEVKKAGGRKPILILVRTPRSDAQATLAIPPR